MKKLLFTCAVIIGTLVSAFPFRSSCGTVFQINDQWASNVTISYLETALKELNANACGVYPSKIIFYYSN